jgi:hypothetical protein
MSAIVRVSRIKKWFGSLMYRPERGERQREMSIVEKDNFLTKT